MTMLSLTRCLQGTTLSLILTGCAAQQTTLSKQSLTETSKTPEQPAKTAPDPTPITCANVPLLLNEINATGYEGDELMRLMVGSIFSMADTVAGRVLLKQGLQARLIADLDGVKDLTPQQHAVHQWLALAKGKDQEVAFECYDEKLEDDPPLTAPTPEFSGFPFREVNEQEARNLLIHYGLSIGPDIRRDLGGRVLRYLYRKDSPHLVMVYLSHEAYTTLDAYAEAIRRQIDAGLTRVAIVGSGMRDVHNEPSESTLKYMNVFAEYPNEPEKAWKKINDAEPDFERLRSIEYFLMSLARRDSRLHVDGVDDMSLVYLSDRFLRFNQAASSPYLRRYFYANAQRTLVMRAQKIVDGLQEPLRQESPFRAVRYETHGGIASMMEIQALELSKLSFILIRAD